MQPEKLSEDASAEVTAMMNTPAPFMRCSVSMVRIQKKASSRCNYGFSTTSRKVQS